MLRRMRAWSGEMMDEPKVGSAAEEDAGKMIVALQTLQGMYSDMLNEYERQIEGLAEISRVPRWTLYNPAVLLEVETSAHRRKQEDVLASVWIAQSEMDDLIAVQRTISLMKMGMSDTAVASAEKDERDIDHENLPYEAM